MNGSIHLPGIHVIQVTLHCWIEHSSYEVGHEFTIYKNVKYKTEFVVQKLASGSQVRYYVYSFWLVLNVHFVILTSFLWHKSIDMDKHISKFSVDSEVAFVSYACFTVSYCCIGHYVCNYYADIINRQFDW